MASNATPSTPSTLASDKPALSSDAMAELDALPGIFQAVENRATEQKLIVAALRKRMAGLDSTRRTLDGQWRRARKNDNYQLADRLKAQLDALPAEDDTVTEKLHEAALALAPLQQPGATLVQRTAYKLAVATLVRRS